MRLSQEVRVCDTEITPEMIEAGAVALSEYDRELESLGEAAPRIYRAMVPARRLRLP